MKNTTLLSILLALSFLILISCSKNGRRGLIDSGIRPSNSFKIAEGFDESIVDEYDHFWVRDILTRGDFNVQTSSKMYYDISSNTNAFFSGVCYGGELVPGPTLNTINNGTFFINDEAIHFINDEVKRYDYKRLTQNIFGRVNTLKLVGAEYEGFIDSIYLPSEILISNPKPNSDSSQYAHVNYSNDIHIEWNIDNRNKKGVVIQITPLNKNLTSGNLGSNILTQDNGHYTLTPIDLEGYGLQVGDQFSIRVYRGNFKLIHSNTQKEVYSFFAHTYSEVNVQLE